MKLCRAASLLLAFCLSISLLGLPLQACAGKTSKSNKVSKAVKPNKKPRSIKSKKRAPVTDAEAEFTNFGQWRAVGEFIDEMTLRHDFDRTVLHAQFARAHFMENVVRLINPPAPTTIKNWTSYRQRFVEPVRINAGVAFWAQHQDTLERAQAEYGVPAEIVVGIIGVETLYGRMAGKIRVMDALTTLAFAYPETPNRDARSRYFRSELEQVLLYARENEIDPFSLSGSFAGAIGWPQFMPGSVRRFAVDFDGDGKIDLRNSPVDAIGSVASFLSQHGWKSGLPLAYPVNVSNEPDSTWQAMIGKSLDATFSLDEFTAAGVRTAQAIPADLRYGLVDLQDGERPTLYWLGTENFFALTKYNRSFFYAMSVIDLGHAVQQKRQP
jgi:membrane-bound lytic murein transglycosylase B